MMVPMDLTVTSLLHDIDLILGIYWLQTVNPLVDWSIPRILVPKKLELIGSK